MKIQSYEEKHMWRQAPECAEAGRGQTGSSVQRPEGEGWVVSTLQLSQNYLCKTLGLVTGECGIINTPIE